MGIETFEVGQMVYLIFNEQIAYRIFQLYVKKAEGVLEDDTLIQQIEFEHNGRYKRQIESIKLSNDVENNIIAKTFEIAMDQCDNSLPIYFHDLAGSETRIVKYEQ